MANVERGEVPLKVGDRLYTLVFDFEASCQIESVLSSSSERVTSHEAFYHALRGRHTECRALVWAGLRSKHPEVTLVQAGELIKEVGGVEAFFQVLIAMDKASRPDAEDVSGRPPEARQDSTGGPTTSTRGASRSRKKGSGG